MRTGEAKEIRLKGLASTNNDYECQDGELQVCHNAINTGKGLRPIPALDSLAELPAGWVGLVFTHHTSFGEVHVIVDSSNNAWFYTDDATDRVEITDPAMSLFSAGNYKITSVGDVLIINFLEGDYKGLNYYRYKDGAYKYLGQNPPDAKLEFSMVHYNGTVNSDGEITYLNNYILATDNQNKEIKFVSDLQFTSIRSYGEKYEDYQTWIDYLLGRINVIKAEMKRQGLFLGKFFIRTAYRLYDGTYIMQSAPILIAPSMEENPMIWPYSIKPSLKTDETNQYWELSVKSKILFRPFALVVKSLIDNAAKLKDWEDVIDRICIFVTPEMQPYTEDPKQMVLTRKQKIQQYGVADQTSINAKPISQLADQSIAETWKEGAYRSYTNEGLSFGEIVRKIYSPPRIETGGTYMLPEGSDAKDESSKSMVQDTQHIALGLIGDHSYSATLYHHQYIDFADKLTTDADTMALDEKMLTEFGGYHHILQFEQKPGTDKSKIEQQYLFYPLKEYTIDEIITLKNNPAQLNSKMKWPLMSLTLSSDVWPRVGETVTAPNDVSFIDFDRDKLTTLTAQTDTLKDDYNSWQMIMPKVVHTYNSRLNLANLKIGFRNMPCTWLGGQALKGDYDIEAQVIIKSNGASTKAALPKELNYNVLVNMGWLYYPHPDAKKLQILALPYAGTGQYYVYNFPLKSHPYLYGAYFYDSDFNIENYRTAYSSEEQARAALDAADGYISHPNYLYSSEADNPFFFPAQAVNAVGSGEIIALKSASKAMSEGTAFGAAPLYAFCTDGIWPLSVGSTGLFIATNPPTRETLLDNDPDSALQIDNSVIFLSDKGLMQLVGERTVLLSQDLAERFASTTTGSLPKWLDINNLFGGLSYMEAPDFINYLHGARLAFDYINYRIIVFRPYSISDANTHVAYIYDISSKMWGTIDNSFVSAVEDYPQSIINSAGDNGIIVGQFGSDNNELIGGGKCIYTTRPLKLDKPDVRKTMRLLIERSILHNSSRYLALWGSHDLVHWHLVSAVNDSKVQRISGMPFKYFVVAGWCQLAKQDSISRLTAEEKDKYTDRIR